MKNIYKYKIYLSPFTGEEADTIIRYSDNPDVEVINFPKCDGNAEYEEYLAWVAEGNTAEPADE